MQTNIEVPHGIQWRPHLRINDLDYADGICLMVHITHIHRHRIKDEKTDSKRTKVWTKKQFPQNESYVDRHS